MLNIIHTTPGLIPESGGPSRSVSGLCSALADEGIKIKLFTVDFGKKFASPILPPTEKVKTKLTPLGYSYGLRVCWVPNYESDLNRFISEDTDLIHDHSLWLPTNRLTAKVARQRMKKLVISPRGTLEPHAISISAKLKNIAWSLYQKRAIESADLLHASSANEAENFRKKGLTQPIAIIPNGVSIENVQSKHPSIRRKGDFTRFLFLGRLHPIKGLHNLLSALASLQSENWMLLLVGPSERGHDEELKTTASSLGIRERVQFCGPVNNENKWQLYQEADYFLLPSHSENFGIVVAEALSCGVPVITTKGTPWSELVSANAGWWIDHGVEPLNVSLTEALNTPENVRQQMGENGKALIEQKYTWRSVATQMKGAYEWLVNGGSAPDCIDISRRYTPVSLS